MVSVHTSVLLTDKSHGDRKTGWDIRHSKCQPIWNMDTVLCKINQIKAGILSLFSYKWESKPAIDIVILARIKGVY